MPIKRTTQDILNEVRGEFHYLYAMLVPEVKARLSAPMPVEGVYGMVDIYNRARNSEVYFSNIDRSPAMLKLFSDQLGVLQNQVDPLFVDVIAKMVAIKNWVMANYLKGTDDYTLNGSDLAAARTYTPAETASLDPLLDDLLTALVPITEP